MEVPRSSPILSYLPSIGRDRSRPAVTIPPRRIELRAERVSLRLDFRARRVLLRLDHRQRLPRDCNGCIHLGDPSSQNRDLRLVLGHQPAGGLDLRRRGGCLAHSLHIVKLMKISLLHLLVLFESGLQLALLLFLRGDCDLRFRQRRET